MQQFSCVIIDDDDIDRLAVLVQARKFPELHVVGAFKSAAEAMPALQQHGIDILFLDIDMPSVTGLELRKTIRHIPVCIFVSSHPEHASRAFELDTLDFIEKPVKSERFNQTMKRINDYFDIRRKASLFESAFPTDAVYIKEGFGKTKIDLHEVRYLEALKDYTKIVTSSESHTILSTLGNQLETEFSSLVRVHRSFAVNKRFVKRIMATEVWLDNGAKIPVGRSYKDNLSQL